MKEEASMIRRAGTLAIAVVMLLTVFVPATFASAETASPEKAQTEASQAAAAPKESNQAKARQVTKTTTANQKAAPPAVTSVAITQSKISTIAGKRFSLKAAVYPKHAAQSVRWSSSNTNIASVSSTGQVLAKRPGTVHIRATAGGRTDTCIVKISLSKPNSVRTKALGTKTIQVRWNKVPGASGYKIYRATSKKGKYKRIAAVKGRTSYTNKSRTTGKAYYYKVRAYSGNTLSAYSNRSTGKARPLQTVVKARAGEEKIRVSWKKVGGAHGYHIYRARSKKGKYTRVKVVNKGKTTAYTNSRLRAGKSYYYKVSAYRKVKGKKVFSIASTPVSTKAERIKLKTSKKGFEYKKKFTVKCYAYSGGGRTAMGTRARVGAIAVDPRVIPLGSKVYVDGYGYAKAEDTGGNIKGKKIDLYMGSTRSCFKWGIKYKTIYVGVKKK